MRVPLIIAMALAVVAALVTPAGHAASAVVERVAGANRIATAIALSRATFAAGSARAVVVAHGGDFPDALAAAPLAAAIRGPVLLNLRERLHPAVRDEIRRLGAGRAYLIGGLTAQSPSVELELATVVQVSRVHDPRTPTRYGTAAAVAREAVRLWRSAGVVAAGGRALIALAEHHEPARAWPDALASGALAGHAHAPILLVRARGVPEATNRALRDLGSQRATVVGGTAAIPDRTKEQLAAPLRDRIGGADRYHTSVLLADEAVANGATRASVVAVTGANFPDGLAAGQAAFATDGVLVLVAARDLVDSPASKAWFERARGGVARVRVAGGTAAISEEVAGQIGFALTDLRLRAHPIASGFAFPLFVTAPPGDPRLFVVEKGGRIWIVDRGTRLARPFLDLSGQVSTGAEQGLFAVAFHPGYATNGRFYVHYTNRAGDTRVVEYRRSSSSIADTSSARTIFAVDQPFANHNGGMLQFARDGRLYLGLGDGGSAGDPLEHGQNPRTPLGAIVRLDPARPHTFETWVHGLRNPWRFAFDPVDGLLYIGDVGQSRWEEIDVVSAGARGTNFGWDVMEGAHCFEPPSGCDRSGLHLPALEYPTGEGGSCSVTGGFVYRGRAIPELRGQYLYADFCAGFVKSFHFHRGIRSDERDWSGAIGAVGDLPSLGTDAAGELYLTSTNGTVYRIVKDG